MIHMTKFIVAILLGVVVFSSTASASVEKGKKIYMKKLKSVCGFNGAKFAIKHTQDEWEKLKDEGKFQKEVQKICPKAKLKSKYVNDVYDFAYEYASDSGNVPSC
ncbi:MAG: cytochrome C [Sulfurovum sp.]|nr:cytochrome C [Sulfurovum sp.]